MKTWQAETGFAVDEGGGREVSGAVVTICLRCHVDVRIHDRPLCQALGDQAQLEAEKARGLAWALKQIEARPSNNEGRN